MIFVILSTGGFAAKCTIFFKYNIAPFFSFPIISNSCFRTFGDALLDVSRWQWAGDEALCAQQLPRRAKWLGARTGHLRNAWHCLPRFVCQWTLYPLSWTQNSSGNPHARIYTPEWPAFSRQWMVATYQDIVPSLSSVPCQQLHKTDNRQTNCCPYLLTRSSTRK